MTRDSQSITNETARPTTSEGDGDTIIADVVVSKVASAAAKEVGGIYGMGSQSVGDRVSGALGAVAGAVTSNTSGTPSSQGVSVEVGKQEAIISLNIIVEYGAQIPAVVQALRKNISSKIQTLTGLTVKAVNVEVSDVHFPDEEQTPKADLQ